MEPVAKTYPVPVVDARGLPGDPETMRTLEDACREVGVFQLVGHGLPRDQLAEVIHCTREFFYLPKAKKRAVERTATNHWGFFDRELTKNRRDWKEIFDVGEPPDGVLAGSQPQWPELRGFRETMEAHMATCRRVALTVLDAICTNLGAPRTALRHAFEPRDTSFLRLNYYPPAENPAPPTSPTVPASGDLAIHHHTDAGALTVLLQDGRPALQVLKDGEWYLVPAEPEAFTINIGDVVQVWSNDRYRAPVHRVIASGSDERFSLPFFFNPASHYDYAPLPDVCAVEAPRYRAINWGEFRSLRAAGDYADQGEEVQIAHYRIAGDASGPAFNEI